MNGKGFSSPPKGKWDFHPAEIYKSLITISVEALKMLALVNGGAAVALLAYLGNLASRSNGTRLPNMTCALACFASGLFLTVLAFIASYLTQLTLYNQDLTENGFRRDELNLAHTVLADPKAPWWQRLKARLQLVSHTFFLYSALALVILAALVFGIGCIIAAIKFAKG